MEQINKSASIAEIGKALHQFHTKFKVVKRNDTVSVQTIKGSYKFNYATLDAILDQIHGDLHECGIIVTQHPVGEGWLNTLIIHGETGEYFESSYRLKQEGSDIKAQGSAITYGRRYALCAILNISIEDDDDAGKASGDKTTREPRQHATGGQQTSSTTVSEKPWLNVLTKDGELTPVGQKVVEAIENGSRTMEQIEAKNSLNKQEKQYLSKVKCILQGGDKEKKPVNNKTSWADLSNAKKKELIPHGEAYIRSAYTLTTEESDKLANYFKSLKQTA